MGLDFFFGECFHAIIVPMRTVIQRVQAASVRLRETEETRAVGPGLVVLIGIGHDDTPAEADWMADKIVTLRIFEDEEGRMNLSLAETGGAMLIVSQFTLLGDARKGRRPSWARAAHPTAAVPLYERFVERIRTAGIPIQTGEFGAEMLVTIENDGPVTLVIDSPPS